MSRVGWAESYLLTSLVLIFSLRHRKVHSAYITNSRARGSRDIPKRNAVAGRSYRIEEYRMKSN